MHSVEPPRVSIYKKFVSIWTTEKLLWLVIAITIVAIAIVPLLYVIDAAFSKETRIGLSDEFSWIAVLNVFTSNEYLGYLFSTLTLASLVTVISLAVGVSMAVLIARTDIPQKSFFDLMIIMPLFLSPFTGMMAWIALGSEKSGFINVFIRSIFEPFIANNFSIFNIWSYFGIVWVMVIFFTPFAYLFTVGNLRGMDSSLEEAARTHGASAIKTLFKISLPLSVPAIFGSGLLIFILACEMYTIPGMIGSNIGYTTLPWKIYKDINGVPVRLAHAAASGSLLLCITCFGIWLQRRITGKTERFATVTGKGFKTRDMQLGRYKYIAVFFLSLYILASDILPFVGLLLSSLMKYSAPSITLEVFTWQNFYEFFKLQNMVNALWNTVFLAILSSIICVIMGLFISYMEVRRPSISTKLLAFIGVLPVAVPGIVYGIGLMWTFLKTPLYGTIWVLLLAYIAKFLPYSIVVSRAGVQQIHPELEQSARICGATALKAMQKITIPILKPTLIAILFFVSLMSIKELSASILLYTQRSQVLSVLTWHYMDAGNYQFAAAIGVLQTLIMIALIFITRRIFNVQLEKTISKHGA